nr:MAG TPA: shock protein B [Caudoviricetes sp.]
MTSHIINVLLLAGASLLLILTGAIAIYAKRSARRDKARCNYRVGDVYHEVLPSPGHEDLYRMYMELQQRITVLEEDYYKRLSQQRRAREEMMNRRRPSPVPGSRNEHQDNRAGAR